MKRSFALVAGTLPLLVGLAAGVAVGIWPARDALAQGGIYTCVDAKGRKITADRPIMDCIDRDQRELSRSGLTVRRHVGPTLTPQEQAAAEDKARRAAADRWAAADEKRRERALLLRYPNRASHDRERDVAIHKVDDIIASSEKRAQELLQERAVLASEMEFYVKDPSKVPQGLKLRVDSNNINWAEHQKFVNGQLQEKERIGQRFDQELLKLTPLWAALSAAAR